MEKGIDQLEDEFRRRFSRTPRFFRAPGRVNLIGEHTDYNEGFVMPFAIDRSALVAGSPRNDTRITAYARDLDEFASIDLSDPAVTQRGSWLDYVEGIARCAERRFGTITGADLIITSTVPIGAGLSSSAAIEIAVGLALLSLSGIDVDRRELAFAAQQAEHEFVGIRSGIMDQFASAFGKEGQALLLDCRSLEIEYIPVAADDAVIAVIDTKVKHNLASTEYNTRRNECEEGVEILRSKLPQVRSLRDVTIENLDEYDNVLPENIRRRCRHVVTENDRTIAAADAFRRSDFAGAGKLMTESHRSLRSDYEVSCDELDFLVETASSVNGVYGSRMTGGGFGGCTVTLLEKSSIDEWRAITAAKYTERFGFEPDLYLFDAADGASEVTA